MRKIVTFCDYFIVCSGTTDRHVKAIADGIDEGLRRIDQRIKHKQGLKDATWIVFDMGDIMVHVFQKQVRAFYNLEYLWRDAKVLPRVNPNITQR